MMLRITTRVYCVDVQCYIYNYSVEMLNHECGIAEPHQWNSRTTSVEQVNHSRGLSLNRFVLLIN